MFFKHNRACELSEAESGTRNPELLNTQISKLYAHLSPLKSQPQPQPQPQHLTLNSEQFKRLGLLV